MILVPSPAPEIANRLVVVVDHYFPSNVVIGLGCSGGVVDDNGPIEDGIGGGSDEAPTRQERTNNISTALAAAGVIGRSAERRVGKECVSPCRSRGSPYTTQKRWSHSNNMTYPTTVHD